MTPELRARAPLPPPLLTFAIVAREVREYTATTGMASVRSKTCRATATSNMAAWSAPILQSSGESLTKCDPRKTKFP
ncbi:hypothetical protein MRX96_022738 [Rhipicephalus microplus]